MPKERYALLREYLADKGSLGEDLMYRSCTVQVNLDWESEADLIQKLRLGLALQPVATALFANSPFHDGKPSGYLSWRAKGYTDTDPDRTGTLPVAFDSDFSFEKFVEFALDVPMYFVRRGGDYIPAMWQSFRYFLDGKLPALPGERPTLTDWEDHLAGIALIHNAEPYQYHRSTASALLHQQHKRIVHRAVRLPLGDRYLEMRGADMGPVYMICALPAFWAGLLYDARSQAECLHLTSGWIQQERDRLFVEAPKLALKTPFRDGTLLDVARTLLKLSREGLQQRGKGERFLDPLDKIAATGVMLAEQLLEKYHTEWGRSVEPLFSDQYYL